MGIFSRHPPDPEISFNLDSRGPFKPGSSFSGTATLRTPVQRQLQSAELRFIGRAATGNTRTQSIGNTTVVYAFKDDACLFNFSQPLTHDMFVAENLPCPWKFDFTFPDSTLPMDVCPYEGPSVATGMYIANEAHALPPSFMHVVDSSTYAKVEYTLQLTCQFEDEREPFVVEPPEPLAFIPPNQNNESPPLSEFVSPTQVYSSSRLVGGEKSFTRSLRDKFSSETPSVNVVLKATVPAGVTTGASFPIYACVEIDWPSTSDINVPTIDVRIESLKFCEYTFYRACGEYGSAGSGEKQSDDEDYVSLNAIAEHCQVEQKQNISQDGRKFWYFPAAFEARVPGDICPSFRTFNINHNFSLEFKLKADICEKEFEFKVEAPGIVGLPP